MGRTKAVIDWDKVGKMLQAGCFAEGIAGILGVDRATLYRRCERDLKLPFATFSQQKKAEGDELLRSKQFQTAMSGNVVMQIWLGKQRLNQSDKNELKADIAVSETNVVRPAVPEIERTDDAEQFVN